MAVVTLGITSLVAQTGVGLQKYKAKACQSGGFKHKRAVRLSLIGWEKDY